VAIVTIGIAELAAAKAGLIAKALEVEKLKLQLARLRRTQSGHSSEKIARSIEQLELRLEELEAENPGASRRGDRGRDVPVSRTWACDLYPAAVDARAVKTRIEIPQRSSLLHAVMCYHCPGSPAALTVGCGEHHWWCLPEAKRR
jgi:hypothetical protein